MNKHTPGRGAMLRFFLAHLGPFHAVLPALTLLGVAGFLAESVGLTFIILLLRILLGADGAGVGAAGILPDLYQAALRLTGRNVALLGVVVLSLIVIKSATNVAYAWLTGWLRHSVSHRLRAALHSQYFDVAYEEIRLRDSGELFNILSADSWALADCCALVCRMVVNICGAGVFGGFIFFISPAVAGVAAAGMLLVFLLVAWLGRPAKALGEASTRANIALTELTLAHMQGMRTLRAFGRERMEKERFVHVSARARDSFLRIERLYTLLGPVNELGALALLGASVMASRSLDVPTTSALAIVLLLYRLLPQLRELDSNRLALDGHTASLRLVRSLLDRKDKIYLAQGVHPLASLQRGVRFEDVGFRYSDAAPWVLAAADFDIAARGVTAILGPSGSGKTTVINLLLRLYAPKTGRILVDGQPLDDIKREDWLARVAVAGQDVELISGTVFDNIALSRPAASAADVLHVAQIAGASTFVEHLPRGLDAPVGDRGINLSGGQRQRIGLARALLADPDLLILDEAVSALELTLQDEIMDRLRTIYADRAIVIVTHHTRNLRSTDHVVSLLDHKGHPLGAPIQGASKLERKLDVAAPR